MISEYQKIQEAISELKCTVCKGHGEVDDAEPGDIAFNTRVCLQCKGTGLDETNADHVLALLDLSAFRRNWLR